MLAFASSSHQPGSFHELGRDRPAGADAADAPVLAEAAGALVLASHDDVVFVCASADRGHGRRGRGGLVYVVVHRSHGVWTHVYHVVRDPRSARLAVFVERVMEGDRLSAALDWAWAGFAAGAADHAPEQHRSAWHRSAIPGRW